MREGSRRGFSGLLPLNGLLISALILSTLSTTSTTRAQTATPQTAHSNARTQTRTRANVPESFTMTDAQRLVANIKDVDSATFRAYLYGHVAFLIWEHGFTNAPMKRLAADAAAAGITDIARSFDEIPPAVARAIAEEMLSLVAQVDSVEAARLKRENAKAFPPPSVEEKAAADFYTAMKRIDSTNSSAQDVEEAARLIESGAAPPDSLHGQLLRLSGLHSPALPRLLSAVLTREEQTPGSFALSKMCFLSYIFLDETMPRDVRVRFLVAAVKAAQQSADDRSSERWAVPLLRTIVLQTKKLTPELYPVAAARLAVLAPGLTSDDVFARIAASDDPVSAAASEAALTSDARSKFELLSLAAHKARERGELRRAAELMASTNEERAGLPEWFSDRDDFLEGVSRKAFDSNDVETARYAVSQIKLANYRAFALRYIASRASKAGDAQSAVQAIDEALKSLKAADDGQEKVMDLLLLAADCVEIDSTRAFDIARAAVKAMNDIRRPKGNAAEVSEFNWHLFPVADAVTKTFRELASRDSEGAQSLAETFGTREFRMAATLGVYRAR